MKNVKWVMCKSGNWCSFQNVGLSAVSTSGVYVIWNKDNVVRVGQGDIANRIRTHRNDRKINRHGNMFVTWAYIPAHEMDGVERYLSEQYSPIEGERFPDTPPIAVNLPGK